MFSLHKRCVALKSGNTWHRELPGAYEAFVQGRRRKLCRQPVHADLSGKRERQCIEDSQCRLKRGRRMNPDRPLHYCNPVPKSGTAFEEGGRWCRTVTYKVDSESVPAHGRPVGIDRNAGQYATKSTGEIHAMPDHMRHGERTQLLQHRLACLQQDSNRYRKTIARHQRKLKHIRSNALRHVARALLTVAEVNRVILEASTIKRMAASVKGAVAQPGKAGAMLAASWHIFDRHLAECVLAVSPAFTPQRCFRCGHMASASRRLRCLSCDHKAHASLNAAQNIRMSTRGGAALPPKTPVIR